MDNRQESDLTREFAAAMDWWREAGVDCTFHDAPANWIAPPAPAEKPAAQSASRPAQVRERAPEPSPPAVDRSSWPQTIEDFANWWLAEPWLDQGRTSGRVAPRGSSGAELMVIVPEPEREDSDRLLSGPQGRLLDAMLAAMGIAQEEFYLASALPRHTPMADWAGLAELGIGEVMAHHIKLARPKRIIAFGGNILPLFGNDLPNSAEPLRRFNQEDDSMPLLAATDLAVLLARPRAKARFWQLWLDWTGVGTT